MKPFRFAQVDLDTSHPAAFARLLTERGGVLTAVYDGGTVLSAAEAAAYAASHNAELFHQPEPLAELADIVFIHSVDWDRHRPLAEPFIRAGVPVFIDKPLGGSLEDCRWFQEQERHGARIFGCSSLPFSAEVRSCLRSVKTPQDKPQAMFITVGSDEFNYAIHAAETIRAVMGAGIQDVRWLGDAGPRECYQARRIDGRIALWHQCGPWTASMMTVTSEAGVQPFNIGASGGLYEPLLDAVVSALADAAETKPDLSTLSRAGIEPRSTWLDIPVDGVRLLLAARQSRRLNGEWVALDDPALEGERFDGPAFGREYARQRRAAKL